VREGRYIPGQRTGAVTIVGYVEQWGKARKNRTAGDDRRRLRDHFASHVGPNIKMHEFGEPEALRFVRSLAERVANGEMAERTARHVRGVVRTMFRDAKLEGVVSIDPFVALPRKLLPKPPRRARNVYTKNEIQELLHNDGIADSVRVLLALMLYTGMREGEACGRRWRDLDRGVRPLASLHVATQYDDELLKTDNPRKVPVHPELERILTWWFDEGFKIAFRRCPAADDFIVPNRNSRATGGGPHTKSSATRRRGARATSPRCASKGAT
jgi:integrase